MACPDRKKSPKIYTNKEYIYQYQFYIERLRKIKNKKENDART